VPKEVRMKKKTSLFSAIISNLLLPAVLCLAVSHPASAQQQGARAPYRIGVGDALEVVVWKNADVSRRVWVRPDGRFTLPLIGEVAAEGVTTDELAKEIATKLKEYLTDPVVTVILETINPAVAAQPLPEDARTERHLQAPGPLPYRIGVEDALEVNVWRNPDVSRQVWVRPDGRITLPLVGEMLAQGLTTGELAAEVESRLKRYYSDAVVNVSLVESNSHTVYVMGMVRTPGALRLRSPKTFLQILTMAGGLQEFADSGNMAVLRWQDGKQKRIAVNAKKMISKGTESDFYLQPGDVVIVP
jgi:polysaccharide biosynthesis/export protein